MQMTNGFGTLISTSHKVFQALTSDRAKQIYKAIVLFIGVLCLAIILGFAKTLQIAIVAASEAFVEALETLEETTEILTVKESDEPQKPEAIVPLETPEATTEILTVQESKPPEPIAPDLRVRTLRKTATARGIPNAGRMKKADLLMALSYAGFLPC